jgi:hypothetical protein
MYLLCLLQVGTKFLSPIHLAGEEDINKDTRLRKRRVRAGSLWVNNERAGPYTQWTSVAACSAEEDGQRQG